MHELYICWICLEPLKMAQCIGQSSHYRRKEHHKLQKQFVAECKLIQNMKFSRTTLYCTLLFVINIYRYKRVVMNLHSGVRMILHTKLLLASVYIIGRCFLYVGAKFSPVGKRHKCVCVLLHQPIYIRLWGIERPFYDSKRCVEWWKKHFASTMHDATVWWNSRSIFSISLQYKYISVINK